MSNDTAQPRVAAPADAFGFGRNWQRYVAEHLTPERERIARDSVTDLVGTSLEGRTFLDIGSGSGLFSLAAHKLGAERVVSVDVDPDSVASTLHLRESAGAPASWTVITGSILDARLVDELEPADVVYSWGVLHHTGDMWTALTNATKLVRPGGGRFVIAIYNDARGARFFDSRRWLTIKRFYGRLPDAGRTAMETGYRSYFWANKLRQGINPRTWERDYRRTRGMAFKTDVADWLGGYPYEYATTSEIVRYCEQNCGLRSVDVRKVADNDTANNEFVFERP
jgi:SAM-dependent methyltransferase